MHRLIWPKKAEKSEKVKSGYFSLPVRKPKDILFFSILVADTQFCKRLCPSVSLLVYRSVSPMVHWTVMQELKFVEMRIWMC